MTTKRGSESSRRKFLLAAGSLAAAPLVGHTQQKASAQGAAAANSAPMEVTGRRKLGSLEVSSMGLGVQNMSRTYYTTVPSRPEMIRIIWTALDQGVTFTTRPRPTGHMRWNGYLAKAWPRSATRW